MSVGLIQSGRFDNLAIVQEFVEDFNRADANSLGGVWDNTYLNTGAALATQSALGDAWQIVDGKGRGKGANYAIAHEPAVTTSRKAWISVENREDLSAGSTRTFYLMINCGRAGSTACSYYWVSFGKSGGSTPIRLGKWWNGAIGSPLASTSAITVGIGDVIRLRHDGNGNLFVDFNGVEILTYSETCYLRATGIGMAYIGSGAEDTMDVDNLRAGTWGGSIDIPDPWYIGDAFDTDSIASGLWTASGTTPPTLSADASRGGVASIAIDGNNTGFLSLTDASLLSADQYVEASILADSATYDLFPLLRSADTTPTGYYGHWTESGTDRWRIGIIGGSELASFNASTPGSHRFRFEAEGTDLRIYQDVAGVWTLRVSASDSSIVAANTVRFWFRDFGGIPLVHDVVVGNL